MSADKKSGGLGAWLVRMLTRFLFLLIVFIAGALTMHFGMHADDHANMAQQQATIDDQAKQIKQLQNDLADAESSNSLDQGTQKALEDQISGLQAELTDVRDKLSFYEQLVPPGPAGSVTIRAFAAEQKDDILDYKVLLTRNAKADSEPFIGLMKFTAIGILDGKEHKVTLAEAGADGKSDNHQLDLQFERFQRSTGVLQLEPGFKVKSVQLEIFEGDTLKTKSEATLGVQE